MGLERDENVRRKVRQVGRTRMGFMPKEEVKGLR